MIEHCNKASICCEHFTCRNRACEHLVVEERRKRNPTMDRRNCDSICLGMVDHKLITAKTFEDRRKS